MSSVTGRISEIKQPRGGFLRPSWFEKIKYDDGQSLGDENLSPITIGLVVDYLSRYMISNDVHTAFDISITGYNRKIQLFGNQEECKLEEILNKITGLDKKSIINACKMCTYDIWYRNPMYALVNQKTKIIEPDDSTIRNIQIMVNRCISFWDIYGPVVMDGFTFGAGYTELVNSGDGDYLTHDTIWDFKVSKNDILPKHTLQILMYYIMGKHSLNKEFDSISKMGFFNPRLNIVYLLDATKVPADTIKIVETEVIGYQCEDEFHSEEEYMYEDIVEKTNTGIITKKNIGRKNFINVIMKYISLEYIHDEEIEIEFSYEEKDKGWKYSNIVLDSIGDISLLMNYYMNITWPILEYEKGIQISLEHNKIVRLEGKEYICTNDEYQKYIKLEKCDIRIVKNKLTINIEFKNEKNKKILKKTTSYRDYYYFDKKHNLLRIHGSIYNRIPRIEYYKKMYIEKSIYVLNESDKKSSVIDIPEGIKTIDEYLFSGLNNIKKVIISTTVNRIGKYAFYKCNNLSSVIINANMKKLFLGVFNSCISIQNITFSDSIIEIGREVFRNCISLKEVKLPNNLQIIGHGAFKNCSALEKVIVPKTLLFIDEEAFNNCPNLKEIVIPKACEIVENSFDKRIKIIRY